MSTTHGPSPIRWTFLAPSCPRPTGGDIARFELVNALARLGTDHVRVVHLPHDEMTIRSHADLPWFAFDEAVEHRFGAHLAPEEIPDGDVVVYSPKLIATALAPSGGAPGRRLLEALQQPGAHRWLPITLLQGSGVFPAAIENLALNLPGPKVCVGSWLADLAVNHGVPADHVVHIPNGLDHERFRILRPIAGRSPRVTMNFDPFPAKRGEAGLMALERLHRSLGVPSTVFGTIPLARALDPGLEFVLAPGQAILAEKIYPGASMFLQPSWSEGFGMCAVEAMACGCALVTTDNGGSADYAIDGETAMICGGEPDDMAEVLSQLSGDDNLRRRIATNGSHFVDRFRWSDSARRLRSVAAAGLADPLRYRRTTPIDPDRDYPPVLQ